MGVPSSIQSEKKYSCYYLQSYVSQLYFSVVFLSHVSQSCFSVVFLSRVPQSCSSVVFLSRDYQSCFSVVFLSRVSQSFLPVVWVVWKNSPFITTASYQPILTAAQPKLMQMIHQNWPRIAHIGLNAMLELGKFNSLNPHD